MDRDHNGADDPIARFAKLGRRDREAILRELSHDQQELVERARRDLLAAEVLEAERRRRTDRQFHHYSPWLASLIEQSEHAVPEPLTKTTADALRDIHHALHTAQQPKENGVGIGLYDRLIDWISPQRGSKA